MVMAIDLHLRRAEHSRQPRPGRDAEGVVQAVARPVRRVSIQVLDERATQRHIDDLLPAADAQGRHRPLHGPARRGQLESVEGRVGRVGAVHGLAVGDRVDVGAARQEQAVETFEQRDQRGPVRQRGHQDRQAAGGLDRLDIGHAQLRVVEPVGGPHGPGGQPDQGPAVAGRA
jgi:hypothetical protein